MTYTGYRTRDARMVAQWFTHCAAAFYLPAKNGIAGYSGKIRNIFFSEAATRDVL